MRSTLTIKTLYTHSLLLSALYANCPYYAVLHADAVLCSASYAKWQGILTGRAFIYGFLHGVLLRCCLHEQRECGAARPRSAPPTEHAPGAGLITKTGRQGHTRTVHGLVSRCLRRSISL